MTAVAPVVQFGRQLSVVVSDGKVGLDLSAFHCKFSVNASDVESPTNAVIRVYNLTQATIDKIKGEYSQVSITAGYQGMAGLIFTGTIKQLRSGRESNISRFFDIFAADNDLGYAHAVVNKTFEKGSTPISRFNVAAEAMGLPPVSPNLAGVNPSGLPRGKVMFGLARNLARDEAKNTNTTWSVQNGEMQIIPMQSYLLNEVVELTSETGLIGVPEQTDQGISAKCLLNARIRVGGLVRINNKSINHYEAGVLGVAPTLVNMTSPGIAFNSRSSILYAASVANDGYYRVYVIEYTGDNRGQAWYCDLTLLALNKSNKTAPVVAKD